METINPVYLNPGHGASTLSHHVPFRGLELQLLQSIYLQGEVIRVHAHTNILVEGESSAGMYILFEGLAGVYKSESSSRRGSLIKTLTHGEAFGEMSLIDRAPRSATVAAEVESILFYLSADAFDRIVLNDPQTGLKLFQNFSSDMSKRLRSMNNDLIVSQRQLWRMTFSRSLSAEVRKELTRSLSGEDIQGLEKTESQVA